MTDNLPDPPPTRIKNVRAFAWLIILLLGLVLGQWLLEQALAQGPASEPPWTAIVGIGVAVGALFLGQQYTSLTTDEEAVPPSPATRFLLRILGRFRWIEGYWRPLALLTAFLLMAFVLYQIPQKLLPSDSFTGLLIVWAVAYGLYLLAVMSPKQPGTARWWQQDWRQWWLQHRWLTLAVVGIVLVALVLRLWQVHILPFTLAGDEASQGLEAIRVLEGGIRNPFSTGWLGVPTMSFFYNSLTIDLMGPTVLALRLPWVLLGTATVLITFYLVKQLKGTRLAVVIALLVATYHYHIHYSRLGSNQVADPFFMALSLLFLYRAFDRRQLLDWALAGGITGVAFYFYAGARLTAVVMITMIGYQFILQPRQFWRQHRTGLLVFVGAFLLVAGPMIQYAIRFPNDFNARLNQVGIIQSGWLEREVVIRNQGVGPILFDQFRRAALAFNFYRDRTVWYGLSEPLLSPFFGSLFLLGLGYCTFRLFGRHADHRAAPMVAWWWGGMLLGGMMTESPPSSQRLITLAVPVCFFIGLALWELIQLASKAIKNVPVNVLLALGVLIFSVDSLMTYFGEYTPQRLYGGPHAELATEIAPLLRDLSPEHRIYFAGAPWMYWGFATLPYLVPQADAIDIAEPFTEPVSPGLVLPGQGAVFIFLPQRIDELGPVKKAFPDGERLVFYSPVDGHLLVMLYVVPPGD